MGDSQTNNHGELRGDQMRYGREYDMERVYDTTEKRCVCVCQKNLEQASSRVFYVFV